MLKSVLNFNSIYEHKVILSAFASSHLSKITMKYSNQNKYHFMLSINRYIGLVLCRCFLPIFYNLLLKDVNTFRICSTLLNFQCNPNRNNNVREVNFGIVIRKNFLWVHPFLLSIFLLIVFYIKWLIARIKMTYFPKWTLNYLCEFIERFCCFPHVCEGVSVFKLIERFKKCTHSVVCLWY